MIFPCVLSNMIYFEAINSSLRRLFHSQRLLLDTQTPPSQYTNAFFSIHKRLLLNTQTPRGHKCLRTALRTGYVLSDHARPRPANSRELGSIRSTIVRRDCGGRGGGAVSTPSPSGKNTISRSPLPEKILVAKERAELVLGKRCN